MSTPATCARCGTSVHAQSLDGLCPACVGRSLLSLDSFPSEAALDGQTGASPNALAITSAESLTAGAPRIAGFRILRQLGEGGFGVVYFAEQLEPVRRHVALKVVKLGMDTRQVVARFEAERQALALMDHPGIAKVFDAGATEAGRPYFVMEFVEGLPITAYADRQRITIRERLELFIQVCNAVQHAHQKGVIHRDLKPSNILVSVRDGQPVPKVIDFGLAKATRVELTDKTLITHFHQLLGTPAYMSPEQVEMGAVDVDTRSDIYALGVLLYELLIGRTPFDTQALLSGGVSEVIRRIREQEPPRPSMRLGMLSAEELSLVASRRQTTPEKVLRRVRGDLDWILMRALEKDRTRRYATANGLAADISRHLRSESVSAHPPTAFLYFQKLVRRNKLAVGAAAAVVLALLTGLSIATVAFVKERHARRDASAKAEENRQGLVRLNVATGGKLVDEGDYFNGLLRFVEALRLDDADPARADIHRRRIGTLLRSAPQLAHLWSHGSLVREARPSPNGRHILTASMDGTACVWDGQSGQLAFPPLRHTNNVELALFTSDDRRIISACGDGRIRLWDAQTGAPVGSSLPTKALWAALDVSRDGGWILAGVGQGVRIFDTTNGATLGPVIPVSSDVNVLRIHPSGRSAVAGGTRANAVILELPSGRILQHLVGTEGLRWAAYSRDGQRLATMDSFNLRMWNTATWELVFPVTKPGGDLMEFLFSPDGSRLAVASWAGFARVLDTTTGLPVGLPMRHAKGVTRSLYSDDGLWIATESRDGTARVWQAETGDPVSTSLPHAGYVTGVNFTSDNSRLITASQDGGVRLWQLPTNNAARLVLRHRGRVVRAQFSPDGSRLLTGASDGDVQIWDAASGELRATLQQGSGITDVRFSPDGRRVLTATVSGIGRVWDLHQPLLPIAVVKHAKAISTIVSSPDGRRFLTASLDQKARVWSVNDGQPLTDWICHTATILWADFSPDGRRVATAGFDKVAQVWDAETGLPVGRPMTHPCEVYRVMFSPDGGSVVTAACDVTELPRPAQVWNAATGEPIGAPMNHRDGVRHVTFSSDGKRIATASEDNTAMVWDSATGQSRAVPLQHRDYVWSVCFSPDNRLLLTLSRDRTARVWDAATGEAVTPPLPHDAEVVVGAWSPDSREVVTCSLDGAARVWDVSPSTAALAELKRQAELLSAHRLEGNTGSVPLTAAELRERWQQAPKRDRE